MKGTFVVVLLLMLLSVACSAEPEIVEVTVQIPVEVTRVVMETTEVEVEATRVVEVTRIVEVVEEIEVTRLVEVERVVTATAEPTITPPASTDVTGPPPTTSTLLLAAMKRVRADLATYGGFIDAAVRGEAVPCTQTVETYGRIADSQEFNVSASTASVRNAYSSYRSAVDVFLVGARDMTQNCRDFLAGGDPEGTIPFQQWGLARQSVNDASDLLNPAIQALGG